MPDIITELSVTSVTIKPQIKFPPLHVFLGWDSREAELTDICAHSIRRGTFAEVHFHYLKHRELRKKGWFTRPWLTRSDDGESVDLTDNKPFSTEFSHSRFLIPALMNYEGWALFMDADMVANGDITKLWSFTQNAHYAVQCVKHNHQPKLDQMKMDGRMQQQYYRKNWSSFVLWNCAHPAHKKLTVEHVNQAKGADLHAFKWIADHEIGALPSTYNWISGVSPKLETEGKKIKLPEVIHYTEGGPWFKECRNVPLGDVWELARSRWMDDGAPGFDGSFAGRKT